MGEALLEVRDLRTYIYTRRGVVQAVNGASFSVQRGETLGIVGESGSGKSMTCLSIMRLLPEPGGRIVGGEILFNGENLLQKSAEEMRQIRGAQIAMILQDPMASLNPAFTIGTQIAEPLRLHRGLRGREVRTRVVELLQQVGISAPEQRVTAFPHQMSGGMRQRVAGAIAISCQPSLLLADEPTTSLDVTIQAQYLRLLKDLQRQTNVALIFVTHDLGIVAKMCDRVAVMYAGQIVESGTTRDIFTQPRHPYTIALLSCLPTLTRGREPLATIEGQPPDLANLPPGCSFAPRCPLAQEQCHTTSPPLEELLPGHNVACWRAEQTAESAGVLQWSPRQAENHVGTQEHDLSSRNGVVILEAQGLTKHFPVTRGLLFSRTIGTVKAVDGIDFRLRQGETLGIVGESGCGKTTTARLVLSLEQATGGSLQFRGQEIATLTGPAWRDYRRAVQAVFQDPYSSLNPRLTIAKTVSEPLLETASDLSKATIADTRGRGAERRWPTAGHGGPLSPRTLRRPAAARGPGAGLDHQSGLYSARRTGVSAGRVDPRPGDEPPAPAPGPPRCELPAHCPRSGRRQICQSADRRHVSR